MTDLAKQMPPPPYPDVPALTTPNPNKRLTGTNTMDDQHRAAVGTIAYRVKSLHDAGRPFRIYHGSTNSTRDSHRDRASVVDTSRLDRVLAVDTSAKTALVEPNVPMDVLVQATLARNLVPLVVMEFPGITCGGGFSGTSGESSSFRHGFFEQTVNWVEIVLGNGEKVRASPTERADLFWGAASSFGTMGVVTLLEVRLREATRYVELTYHSVGSVAAAMEVMERETADPAVDYLDGIVFAADRVVICSGRLADTAGGPVCRFTRRWDPWFYLHVDRVTKNTTSHSITEWVPLPDYLFRYDRGGFWVAQHAYVYFLVPFIALFRFLLDSLMRTRVMYHALHASGLSQTLYIQDVAIPYDKAADFHAWIDDTLGIYPLWLCPLRQRRDGADSAYGMYGSLTTAAHPEFLMNFGVWGMGSPNRDEYIKQNRALERKVADLGGRKWLYARTYYTEDEFWNLYDHPSYDALRQKYSATGLPDIYSKVGAKIEDGSQGTGSSWRSRFRARPIWPFNGLYGVYKAILGGDYLLQRQSQPSLPSLKSE